MKKRILTIVLSLCLIVSLSVGALASAAEANAHPNVKVTLDGKLIPADVYTIENRTYLRLVDIAYALDVSATYDAATTTVVIKTDAENAEAGQPEPLPVPNGPVEATAHPNVKVTLDGQVIPVEVYAIGSRTFLRLVDITAALGLEATYDANTVTVVLTSPVTPESVARAYVQLLIDGKYEESETMLSDEMIAFFEAAGGTEVVMQAVYAQIGAFQSIVSADFLGSQDGYQVVLVTVATDQNGALVQIVIDGDGNVATMLASPAVEVEDPIAPPKGFVETEIEIDAGTGYPLEGRLVKPEKADKKVPLIVLIQGSGATNYDEIAGANRVFGQLAYGLAERGIATLRYDKRTYAYPEIGADPAFSVKDEYVEDVLAAVKFAGTVEGIGEVYILGHSQGGMLAPMFLAEGADAAGMILFAGSPRSLLDIIEDQLAENIAYYEAAGLTAQAEEIRTALEDGKTAREALSTMTENDAKKAGDLYGMFGAYYALILEKYDALSTITELEAPTLILQGGADRQVLADVDYQLYLDALSDEDYVSFKLYEGLNHMFMPGQAANIVEAFLEYNTKSQIPAGVFDDIAAWIAGLE